jgi:hypothetical protein
MQDYDEQADAQNMGGRQGNVTSKLAEEYWTAAYELQREEAAGETRWDMQINRCADLSGATRSITNDALFAWNWRVFNGVTGAVPRSRVGSNNDMNEGDSDSSSDDEDEDDMRRLRSQQKFIWSNSNQVQQAMQVMNPDAAPNAVSDQVRRALSTNTAMIAQGESRNVHTETSLTGMFSPAALAGATAGPRTDAIFPSINGISALPVGSRSESTGAMVEKGGRKYDAGSNLDAIWPVLATSLTRSNPRAAAALKKALDTSSPAAKVATAVSTDPTAMATTVPSAPKTPTLQTAPTTATARAQAVQTVTAHAQQQQQEEPPTNNTEQQSDADRAQAQAVDAMAGQQQQVAAVTGAPANDATQGATTVLNPDGTAVNTTAVGQLQQQQPPPTADDENGRYNLGAGGGSRAYLRLTQANVPR